MILRIWFAEPIEVTVKQEDEELVANATFEELFAFLNENWVENIDPSLPLISSVEVVK